MWGQETSENQCRERNLCNILNESRRKSIESSKNDKVGTCIEAGKDNRKEERVKNVVKGGLGEGYRWGGLGEEHKKMLDQDTKVTVRTRYWLPEEHERFLTALKMYGNKDIKSIASFVGSRNCAQVPCPPLLATYL